jgi:hypothetical protein
MMKFVLFSLVLLLLPVMNAHRLLGSLSESSDQIPIENHLSPHALQDLERAVDHSLHSSQSDKTLLSFFYRFKELLMSQD